MVQALLERIPALRARRLGDDQARAARARRRASTTGSSERGVRRAAMRPAISSSTSTFPWGQRSGTLRSELDRIARRRPRPAARARARRLARGEGEDARRRHDLRRRAARRARAPAPRPRDRERAARSSERIALAASQKESGRPLRLRRRERRPRTGRRRVRRHRANGSSDSAGYHGPLDDPPTHRSAARPASTRATHSRSSRPSARGRSTTTTTSSAKAPSTSSPAARPVALEELLDDVPRGDRRGQDQVRVHAARPALSHVPSGSAATRVAAVPCTPAR